MPDDSPRQPVESPLESRLTPGHVGILVEAAGQRQERHHEAHGDEHHHGTDRRHDAEVVDRPHAAGHERTEADHVGGDGAGHRPEQRGDRRPQGVIGGRALSTQPPVLDDHVRHGADADHGDHRREHRRDHGELESGDGQQAAGGPEREEHHREGHHQPAETAEAGEQDSTGEQAAERAEQVAVAFEHRKAVPQHRRFPGERAHGQVCHPRPQPVDRAGAGDGLRPLRGGAGRRRFEHAGDAGGPMVGPDDVALEERHQPAGPARSQAAFEIDDRVAQRCARQARHGGDPREGGQFGGQRPQPGDAFGREQVGVVVGREHHLARPEGAGHPLVWRQRRISPIEHRVDRFGELQMPGPLHRSDGDHRGREGEPHAVADQKHGDPRGDRGTHGKLGGTAGLRGG